MRDITRLRLESLAPRVLEWKDKPRQMPEHLRKDFAMMVAATFSDFREFAELGMKFLGFSLTDIQADIAEYMQHGPRLSMVQAQRGEAKSTLAALFAVWSLVQDNNHRVLVVSAGEKMANQMSVLIVRLLEHWGILCYLRPDASAGDRESYESYDVHYSLRRERKSASVASLGITANLPGNRADLLIPDDIESPTNSYTQPMRDKLVALSKEFTSICTDGRILYLGTPQNKDSIYKTLPQRGFEVRIWPGRYPNKDEMERYALGTLAPIITSALDKDASLGYGYGLDGTRGRSTDLVRYSEEKLIEKELDKGPEDFNLQYMLDTSLSDALRTKLKLVDLMFFGGDSNRAPEYLTYGASVQTRVQYDVECLRGVPLYSPGNVSLQYVPYTRKIMVIDPAGKGGDEVAYCVGGACQSYVHIFSVGGLRGGMSTDNMEELVRVMDTYGVKELQIESNMGAGTVTLLFRQYLESVGRRDIGVSDYWSSTQKERRIIDLIGPMLRRHKLVIHTTAVEDDDRCCKAHPINMRTSMSVWYQLSSITYDKGCLSHDDRADAMARVVSELAAAIAVDDQKQADARRDKEAWEFIQNPMGRNKPKQARGGAASWIDNKRR